MTYALLRPQDAVETPLYAGWFLASTETFMGLSTMDNADLLDSEKCGEKGID